MRISIFITDWPFVPSTIGTASPRGIREIWRTVIAEGGGYLFLCTGRDTHLSGGLTSASEFHGFSGTPNARPRREGSPKDMNFHSHRIILSIKRPRVDGRRMGNPVFNGRFHRGSFVQTNWRPSVLGDKDSALRIEKSIEKKRIVRGILRAVRYWGIVNRSWGKIYD